MGAVRSKKISRGSRFLVSLIATLLILGIASFGITIAVLKIKSNLEESSSIQIVLEPEVNPEPAEEPPKEEVLTEIDFQPVVDEWVKTVGGNKSILIYDFNFKKIVGSYNTEEIYNTASLYKLFVVYEGYKRLSSGEWNGNDMAGSTGYTIAKCLDLAIRESHSVCAETIRGMIGYQNLNTIISTDKDFKNTNLSNLTSAPVDILNIIERFYLHPDFDDPALLDKMWDSFLNQPATEYDWRQGLPRGFNKASVYNKVGWDFDQDENYWKIYHDAAIIKFPLEDGSTRDFAVVVMTNKVDFKNIRKLGQMIENKFYEEI